MLTLSFLSSPPPSPSLSPRTSAQPTSPDCLFFPSNPISRPVFATLIKKNHNLSLHPELVRELKKFESIGGMRTISGFNTLLMSLVSADEFELALKLKSSLSSFSGLCPDSRTYSILVDCYCKKNEPAEAKRVLDQMLEKGFQPNVATFTTLIHSFSKIGRLRDAYEAFDIMSSIGCEPTINTYNCLLKGLCYLGRVEEAYALMERIRKSKSPTMKPDIYTYTTMMDGFCKVGRSTEALELLDEALEMELTPNVVTYNTLFNSYIKEGKPLRGFGMLRRMRERKCRPDYICYSTFLHGLLKWGKTRAALQIYKEMEGADERMTNTLLRALCRRSREESDLVEEVERLYEEMRGRGCAIRPPGGYDLVVDALCAASTGERQKGKAVAAYEVVLEMVGRGHSPKTFTFNVAIGALCGAGEADKAVALLMLMHRWRNPNRTPFHRLIRQLNQRGRSLEASAVYGLAIKRGLRLPLPLPLPRTSSQMLPVPPPSPSPLI
ncbi:pentatricopeptide repeat-containing protein At1g62910-like [Andrographis paniculata]|uniref:pentatricopeptide repeat-containing protein At1g62910-like n=1 Tax=Andrographis paniculata TaxID=175694 RepID=UPI0021E7946B|nr:pentatricopeptide repeat-containing protein At1g62910-like [Andrographis paniculata]